MAINFEEYNRKINKLAVELVTCNPADININPEIKRLQNSISTLVFDIYSDFEGKPRLDKFNNEVRYFPLVKQDVTNDVFVNTLYELIAVNKEGRWAFNPEKGSFITALKYLLPKRMLNYYKKNGDGIEVSADEETVDGITRLEMLEDESSENKYDEVLDKITGLGSIINVMNMYGSRSAEQNEKEQKYFKGFFTFDTTRAIKSDEQLADVACEYDSELFPCVSVSLLEYLMTGIFKMIADIAANPLRSGIDLNKRGEMLENFFDISHPTFSKFNVKYDKFVHAIFGSRYNQAYGKFIQSVSGATDI